MQARSLVPCLLPAILAGCVGTYVHPPGEPTARVQLAPKAMPLICVRERPVRLRPDADGYARIPAVRPITLVAQFEGHDFVCMPPATFTAEPDARYVQAFAVRARACSTSIAKEGEATQVAASEAGAYGCRGRP